MAQKKYVSLTRLSNFLDNIKAKYSQIGHKHTVSDLTDYKVDSELSASSLNPVQNKVLNEEFNAVATAMNALEAAIDTKSDSGHNHNNLYYTETEVDQKLSGKANTTHSHVISEVTNLQTTLDAKVPTSRTINSKPLTANVSLSASDVGAAPASHSHNDLYYTETEIDTLLSTKSDTTHNHDSKYDTKGAAAESLVSAKSYADSAASSAANAVKNDLLNGAGAAYDTLKELGDLINENTDAIDALETVAAGKADKVHTHAISEVTNLQTTLDELQADINAIPQSDWNQSDDTKLDYIKNRTHWSKTESTVVSEETVDTSDYTYYFTTPFALNVGQTYIVVFDGTTYNCVAFRDNMNYNRTTIGGSYGDFSVYPFSICVKSSGDTCIETEVLSTHTVKVTNVVETIQQLDEKYIPDTFAKVDYVEDTVAEVENTLTDKINRKANSSDITSGFATSVVATLDTSNWKGVAYGDGKYIAVGDRKFAYSTDGESWQYGTLPFYANGIAYGNGMFCAYGYSSNAVCYSTDGINWSTADTNYNSNYFSIYYLNDRFVISAGYAILSSTDCVTWSKFELGESCTLYGGAYGNGVYIMSGYGDTFISTNGTSWTKTTALSTTENYGSIFFVGGKFIAIAHGTTSYGASNKVAYSTNGTSWTYGTLPISAKWVEGSYCNGTFMIAGYQSLAYSNDGVNWTTGSLPEGWNTIETMGSGNEFLLFEGSGNEVATAKQNPYDLVFKPDTNWVQIYDSGETTEQINSFANINIAGYKKIMMAIKCVNDTTNASTTRYGSAIFKATNGTTYQFPVFNSMFFGSETTTASIGFFEFIDGWIVCPQVVRSIKYADFLTSTEGGTCTNMNNMGSGIMKCTNSLSTVTISSLDQNADFFFGVGSRVIVWGCNA